MWINYLRVSRARCDLQIKHSIWNVLSKLWRMPIEFHRDDSTILACTFWNSIFIRIKCVVHCLMCEPCNSLNWSKNMVKWLLNAHFNHSATRISIYLVLDEKYIRFCLRFNIIRYEVMWLCTQKTQKTHHLMH